VLLLLLQNGDVKYSYSLNVHRHTVIKQKKTAIFHNSCLSTISPSLNLMVYLNS